ncbi:MAG: acetyl-CoA carboxylase biotin carboxyl carrier protein subunit [Gemmatimonadota bacterium]|nr:MAG: acetyl-CoA carboxylase biotin carboxyl carrier protein subunit [Gemmatimonadota bacterium]
MDEARLKRLIRMVEDSDIEELEIDRPFGRIRITKRRAAPPPVTVAAPAAPAAQVAPPPAAPVATAAPVAAEAVESPDPNLVAIAAPMVGTYYSAPAPGAKPYISVGDKVSVGQVVCIVEAMKLMNEVQSEVAGTVMQVRCENGQAVEYGQELFSIDPV